MSLRNFQRLLRRRQPAAAGPRRFHKRSIVTFQAEPPLDSTVPERPCSIALAQDRGLYGELSAQLWEDQCSTMIPNEFGMTFASLELERQEDLEADLTSLSTPQAVLVARGPLVSWWAQLHLESYSLAGVILIDPLMLYNGDPELVDQVIQASEDAFLDGVYLNQLYYEAQNRPLLLEPGPVPMVIIQSRSEYVFEEGVQQTIQRHGIDEAEESTSVPIITLKDDRDLESTVRDSLVPWIENRVL